MRSDRMKLTERAKKISITRIERIRSGMIVSLSGLNHPFYGKHHSNTTKSKISAANFGRRFSMDINQRKGSKGILNPFYGKHHSDDVRAKLSVISKQRINECGHPMSGKHHHDETKFLLSKKALGRKCTADTRMKMSSSHIGKHHSVDVLRKILASARTRPNDFESDVLLFLNLNYPNQWMYCGDGSVIVNGHSPDFILSNGKKEIILANGVWWHVNKYVGMSRNSIESVERAPFESVGFKVTHIWSDDFYNFWENDSYG